MNGGEGGVKIYYLLGIFIIEDILLIFLTFFLFTFSQKFKDTGLTWAFIQPFLSFKLRNPEMINTKTKE